jgi:hypothetical protein
MLRFWSYAAAHPPWLRSNESHTRSAADAAAAEPRVLLARTGWSRQPRRDGVVAQHGRGATAMWSGVHIISHTRERTDLTSHSAAVALRRRLEGREDGNDVC